MQLLRGKSRHILARVFAKPCNAESERQQIQLRIHVTIDQADAGDKNDILWIFSATFLLAVRAACSQLLPCMI